MSKETNREAAPIARTETVAAARAPWTTPTLSCIYASDAQVGSGDGIDLTLETS